MLRDIDHREPLYALRLRGFQGANDLENQHYLPPIEFALMDSVLTAAESRTDFEQALSLGRIGVLLLAVFIFFADIIGLYSPVGLVLWMSLLRLMQGLAAWRFFAWWSVCAIRLALEFSFFRSVSAPLPE